ncbi:hypothetical protein ACWCQS_05590 [Streptomyces sp. NPDC002076]
MASSLRAWWTVTEGDRRGVLLELHKPKAEEQSTAVLAIAGHQRDLRV